MKKPKINKENIVLIERISNLREYTLDDNTPLTGNNPKNWKRHKTEI